MKKIKQKLDKEDNISTTNNKELNQKNENNEQKNEEVKSKNQNKFFSLSSYNMIEENSIYFEALDFALKKNNNIFNIAVTGKYGSGKTSVLESYKKHRKDKYKFLNISLASFKDNGQDNNNMIERSILQQLFYKVDSSKIPNSRFKRIKNIRDIDIKKCIIKYVVIISVIFFALYFIFNPEYINLNVLKGNAEKLYNKFFISSIKGVIIFLFAFALIYGVYYLLFRILKRIMELTELSNIKLKKQEIEIEVGKSNSNKDSIFNKYLDEIIYFFEKTEYDTIIIEDIDRFKSSNEVFIKLRELNTILNNYENINKEIKFVYTVKDEIFEEKERTKFFDFIIPIIPVINSFNSRQKLLDKLPIYGEKGISMEYIRDISLYIDDMRILNNIMNEFTIYRASLPITNLIIEKLFSVIVLKNINPKEFAELQSREGFLYDILNTKNERLNNYKIRLEKQKKELIKELSDVELANRYSLKNIKMMLWFQIKDVLDLDSNSLTINNNIMRMEDFIASSNKLEDIKKSVFKESMYGREINVLKFNEIMEKIPEQSRINIDKVISKNTYDYNEEKNLIESKIADIENLLNQIKQVNNNKLSYLISNFGFENLKKENECPNNLILFLLKEGYLDEDYEEYINYFYSGELKLSDKEFIISLKSGKKLDYSYELKKIKEIIDNLSNQHFSQIEILNFDLLNFILENNEKYNEELNLILNLIKNKKSYTMNFCTQFIQQSKNTEKFVKYLSNIWDGIWQYVSEIETDAVKKIYAYNILKYAETSDIKKINEKSSIEEYIAKESSFIKNFNEEELEKIEEVIKELNIKFENIDKEDIIKKLGNFITSNNYYKVNEHMISIILERKYKCKIADIKNKNFTCIINTKDDKFIQYIYDNIEEYLDNVYLKHEELNDNSSDIIKIINNENVLSKNKEEILRRQVMKIDDISKVNKDLFDTVLENNKILAKWDNVVTYYKEYGINEKLIDFINNNIQFHNGAIDFENKSNKFIYEFFNDYYKEIMSLHKNVPFNILETVISVLKKNDAINLIINQAERLSEENVYKLLDCLGAPYNTIGKNASSKLEINETNKMIIDMLSDKKKFSFISSTKTKNDKFYIYKKRNN